MEFASVVTDGDLNIIKEGPEFVVHISDADLGKIHIKPNVLIFTYYSGAMDEWCTKTHGQTGLTEKCRSSKDKISDWDTKVSDFIRENCPTAPIAGNTVHMDLNFMRKGSFFTRIHG